MRPARRLTAAVCIYLVGIVVVSAISYLVERQRYLEDIDARLYAAASNLPSLLAPDFHDIARTSDAISPAQDRLNQELLNSHARSADMTYIYSYVMVGDMIYFTSCNYTEEDVANDQIVTYWTSYPEGAQKYYDAMDADEPVYVTAGDRWGLFRTILLPLKSPSGLPYVAAADMDITVIEQALIDDMLYVLGLSLLLAFIVAPLVWAYHKTYSEMNAELHSLNDQLKQDIEQARVLENELKLANHQAQEASRVKSQFLSNMSHELRTPINGILGTNQLLLETRLDDEQYEFVQLSHQSAHLLLDTVNQILDTAAIEANGMVLHSQVVDTEQFFDELVKMFSAQVASQQLDLTLHVQPGFPARLEFDPVRLRQVFINLIANALKFTRDGGVAVNVGWQNGVLAATVSDTGIGIPADAQRDIFNIFHQADNSSTRQHDGNGLGLSIALKICELMDGELQLERSDSSGSVFRFQVFSQAADPALLAELTAASPAAVAYISSSALLQQWLAEESGGRYQPLSASAGQLPESVRYLLVDGADTAIDWPALVAQCQQQSCVLVALLYAGQHLPADIEAALRVIRKPLTRVQLREVLV